MALDHEACYAALHARLEAKLKPDPFHVVTRRRVDSAQMRQQPALQVVETGAVAQVARNLPTIWTLQADAVVFAQPSKGSDAPGALLSALLRAVEAALEREPDERPGASGEQRWTTLGGLVQHAWISGPIERGYVPETDQAIVFIPIEMVTTTAQRG